MASHEPLRARGMLGIAPVCGIVRAISHHDAVNPGLTAWAGMNRAFSPPTLASRRWGTRSIGFHGVDEELVDSFVVREFWVEGGCEQVALTDEGGGAFAFGEHFHVRSKLGDAWGADIDHFDGAAGQGSFGFEDAAVVLAAVGVALDGDVEPAE